MPVSDINPPFQSSLTLPRYVPPPFFLCYPPCSDHILKSRLCMFTPAGDLFDFRQVDLACPPPPSPPLALVYPLVGGLPALTCIVFPCFRFLVSLHFFRFSPSRGYLFRNIFPVDVRELVPPFYGFSSPFSFPERFFHDFSPCLEEVYLVMTFSPLP